MEGNFGESDETIFKNLQNDKEKPMEIQNSKTVKIANSAMSSPKQNGECGDHMDDKAMKTEGCKVCKHVEFANETEGEENSKNVFLQK